MRESREKATASGAASSVLSGSVSGSPHGSASGSSFGSASGSSFGAASSVPSGNAGTNDVHGVAPNGRAPRKLPLVAAATAIALLLVALAFVAAPRFLANDPADNSAQFAASQLAGEKGESSGATLVAEDLSKSYADARENSVYLQYLIDTASRQGGGTIEIPEGTFCFAATGEHELGSYAVLSKNNVKIIGAGQDATKLMPVGDWAETGLYRHGVDMFAHFGVEGGTYLVNADFENFTIDGSLTQGKPEAYNASGKGFYFKLFEDCNWRNVTVKNTDGTGFGMDFPINSSLENCVAIGCGKNATAEDVGASGFGIGTGYSEQESIFISNCEAYDNTKYGFFFEHQTRFASEIEALKAEGFVVVECVASGNLYNFGGARAHDVTYKKCTSKISEDAEREAYTARAFCFENHSCRTTVADCVVEQRFADVEPSDSCYVAAHWALEGGLLESALGEIVGAEGAVRDVNAQAGDEQAKDVAQLGDVVQDASGVQVNDVAQVGEMLFHPNREMLRSEAVALLWRYDGRPGEVWPGGTPSIPVGYSDVSVDDYYIDAVLWMSSLNAVDAAAAPAKFRGGDLVTRAELITMLWRMAGAPEASLTLDSSITASAYEGLFFEKPYAWALDQGVISEADFAADPYSTCTRAEIVMLLHAYDAR